MQDLILEKITLQHQPPNLEVVLTAIPWIRTSNFWLAKMPYQVSQLSQQLHWTRYIQQIDVQDMCFFNDVPPPFGSNPIITFGPNRRGHATSKLIKRFKSLLKQAGLPEIRFHDLRHTAVSLMLNNGVPLIVVSRRLGHSQPSITLDVYRHIIPSIHKEMADMMDEITNPIEVDINI